MRNATAKSLKREVAFKMYVGDDVTWEDVKKDKKAVFGSPEFKSVYRAKKKNHMKTITHPKHMDTPLTQKEKDVLKKMFLARKKKESRKK